MSHILCHDIAAWCCGCSQHDKERYQHFVTEAHADGKGQENGAKKHQLDATADYGGHKLLYGLASLEAGAKGNQGKGGCQLTDIADGFGNHDRKGEPQ